MKFKNLINSARGNVYYGMHFYPGVAEYQEHEGQPYRVYLNEDTIRSMDPTFSGRPIFVEHVDGVDENIDKVKQEADGWVIESFYNSADGKHWVKFIVVSEKGERAIKNGMRLSNAYLPKSFGSGGLWNGVEYAREITSGEYEHLAIVRNPRYDESVIMSPEQFKQYNENHLSELKRLSNSKEGETTMKLNFFKKQKVENAIDPDMSVVLPKSGKEILLTTLVTEADEAEHKRVTNAEVMADPSHKVKLHDGSVCNIGELIEKHKAMHDELESMKKDASESEGEVDMEEKSVDVEGDKSSVDNDEDAEAKKKALALAEHEEKEMASKKNELEEQKKKDAKEKADRLRNAHKKAIENEKEEQDVVALSSDLVARGKARYGS